MKKTVFILLMLVAVPTTGVLAQKWQDYLHLAVGTGYLMDADIKDGPSIALEYGKTYQFLDLGVALEYANDHFKYDPINMTFTSILFKARIDFLRMFIPDSRHALKLGVGLGGGSTGFQDWYGERKDPAHFYALFSCMASYEFRVADKTWVGAFFNNYPSTGAFDGLNYLGLSIRRYF